MSTSEIKSQVMKRAWSIFKSKPTSQWGFDFSKFSDCLRRAWEIIKSNIAHRAEKEKEAAQAARPKVELAGCKYDADYMRAYYSTNAYKGD